jgi:hypothetical protein
MINEFAEFKSEDKAIRICLGNDIFVTGKIMEINPEYVVINWDGKRTVVQKSGILYFQEAIQ